MRRELLDRPIVLGKLVVGENGDPLGEQFRE